MSTTMMSRRSLLQTTAVVSALAMAAGLSACGGSSSSGASDDVEIPAAGTDDGTELTMWSRAPLERQVNNAVDAYNASHKNQIKVELLPNDDVEGKVGAAIQTDGLPDILAGDVVRIPYWVQQAVFADNNDTASSLTVLADGYSEADERTRTANAAIANGRTPVAVNFNEAFNAAGSPWQLLIQDGIWGDGSKVDTYNEQIDAVLAQ